MSRPRARDWRRVSPASVGYGCRPSARRADHAGARRGRVPGRVGGRVVRRAASRSTPHSASLLVAEIVATAVNAALTNLQGRHRRAATRRTCDIAAEADVVLGIVESIFDDLVADASRARQVRGTGVRAARPGGVQQRRAEVRHRSCRAGTATRSGRAGPSRYQARGGSTTSEHARCLGELRSGIAVGVRRAIFVMIGTGIGAGSSPTGADGGAQGAAGDIGHVRVMESTTRCAACGKVGCLEALAVTTRSPVRARACADGVVPLSRPEAARGPAT